MVLSVDPKDRDRFLLRPELRLDLRVGEPNTPSLYSEKDREYLDVSSERRDAVDRRDCRCPWFLAPSHEPKASGGCPDEDISWSPQLTMAVTGGLREAVTASGLAPPLIGPPFAGASEGLSAVRSPTVLSPLLAVMLAICSSGSIRRFRSASCCSSSLCDCTCCSSSRCDSARCSSSCFLCWW